MSPIYIFKNTLTDETVFVNSANSDLALQDCLTRRKWNPAYITYVGRSLDPPQEVRDPAPEGPGQ